MDWGPADRAPADQDSGGSRSGAEPGGGFRPTASVAGWAGALGVLAAFTFALTWFSVAVGLWAKTVESASNIPMVLILLPFLSSGFVPTDSLPTALRWFAEYEPFTPVIESVRGLLLGSLETRYLLLAIGWSVLIAAASSSSRAWTFLP